jgi:hypothetical protein
MYFPDKQTIPWKSLNIFTESLDKILVNNVYSSIDDEIHLYFKTYFGKIEYVGINEINIIITGITFQTIEIVTNVQAEAYLVNVILHNDAYFFSNQFNHGRFHVNVERNGFHVSFDTSLNDIIKVLGHEYYL